LYGTRPAALAASYACIFSLRTVDIRSLSLQFRMQDSEFRPCLHSAF